MSNLLFFFVGFSRAIALAFFAFRVLPTPLTYTVPLWGATREGIRVP